MVTVRILGATEHAALQNVAADVFDGPINSELTKEFLIDPRHHLAVAVSQDGQVVGMASAVHYVHPDKPAQMFINDGSAACSM